MVQYEHQIIKMPFKKLLYNLGVQNVSIPLMDLNNLYLSQNSSL